MTFILSTYQSRERDKQETGHYGDRAADGIQTGNTLSGDGRESGRFSAEPLPYGNLAGRLRNTFLKAFQKVLEGFVKNTPLALSRRALRLRLPTVGIALELKC
jgi:hypothetical protein